MKPFRIGIDSYSLSPLKLSDYEDLDWAAAHEADGVQFTELHLRDGEHPDDAYLADLARHARQRGLYLEWGGGQHIPFDLTSWQRKDLLPINTAAAKQAHELGTRVVRSCSGGLIRWKDDSPPTETLLLAIAAALKPHKPLLTDLNIVLAIELHFEFTTFELLRLFEMCDVEPGGWLGICLDPMNLLTMLEDPVAATERILPWIVAVHAKDGGLLLDDQGLTSFPTEAGNGAIDFDAILTRLATLDRPLNLSVEDHGGRFALPIFDPVFLSRFPDLTAGELARLLRLARKTQNKVQTGRIAPLERAAWPELCEQRVHNGVQNMKRIVARLQQAPAGGL